MRNKIFSFFILFLFVILANCASRILLFLFNQNLFDVNLSQITQYIFLGLRFDISVVAYANILFAIVYFLPFINTNSIFFKRFLFWIWLIPNLITIIPNIIDAFYYPFVFRRLTHDAILIVFTMKHEMQYLAFDFITDFWPAYIIFLIFIYAFVKIYKSLFNTLEFDSIYKKQSFIKLSVLILMLFGLFLGVRGGIQKKPIGLYTAGRYASLEHTPLVMNSTFSIIRTWGKTGVQKKYFFHDFNQLHSYFSQCKQHQNRTFKQKNVVIIILESFSNEYLYSLNEENPMVKDVHFTPFLDSLIYEGYFCYRAYANNKRSIEGVPAIVSSMPSLMNTPFILSQYSTNVIPSIASLLKPMGYTSCFFHGGQNGTMNFDSYAYGAGFDKYSGMDEYPNQDDFDGKWGIWDEPYLQFVANECNKMSQPFVAVVFTLSSHHPFNVPMQYQQILPKGPHPLHQAIAYTDLSLRKFFQTASKMPWFDNTLFIITSDHTSEPFLDWYKTNVGIFSIPLLFYDPGNNLKGHTYSVCQQSDILPSIMDYLGYSEKYTAFGNSIFQENRKGFQISWLGDKYQIITDSLAIYFIDDKPVQIWNFLSDKTDVINEIQNPQYQNFIEYWTNFYKSFIQQYNNSLVDNKRECNFEK